MKNCLMFLMMGSLLASCGEDEKPLIDTEYPKILIEGDSFPLQCSVIDRGSTLQFKAYFSDNIELGSYSLDIHHNFDHHTHSTEVSSCNEDAIKMPENPLLLIQTYTIPDGRKEYVGIAEIEIPSDIDLGDYHFLIRLTDHEGWQTLQGLSIKIK